MSNTNIAYDDRAADEARSAALRAWASTPRSGTRVSSRSLTRRSESPWVCGLLLMTTRLRLAATTTWMATAE